MALAAPRIPRVTSALAERQLSSVCSSQAALADYLYFWLALRNLSQTTTTTTRMINRAASLIVPILRIGAAGGATPLPAWLSLVERERFPENLHKLEFPLWRLLTGSALPAPCWIIGPGTEVR